MSEIIERVWEMRYGHTWTLFGWRECGCTAEQHIDDPSVTTFTLPELPPCEHRNTEYVVCCKVTATNTA
jgi:hypothetical protein